MGSFQVIGPKDLDFFSFRLESPILGPKISVFAGFYPRILGAHRSDPQKALSSAERRILSPHWSTSDAQCDTWPWQRNQKKKEKRQWQTGYLPRPPTSPYRSQSLYAGWSPVCSSIFQVLLKSVQWFWRCAWVVEYRLSPLLWPLAYTTACTTVYKPWCSCVLQVASFI